LTISCVTDKLLTDRGSD